MSNSDAYQYFVRFTALMLVIGVALPTGLQAKELVDYCLDQLEQSSDMKHDHSCCPSESGEAEPPDQTESDDATQHNCDWQLICACHIDRAPLSDQNWTTPNTLYSGSLAEVATLNPENHTDSFQFPNTQADTYSTTPLFLLNSTFLN
jgi:hypothetical protein